MRLAFDSAGAECVFSSDCDKYAQQTYAANFGHSPAGNIREIAASEIADHDILLAGFPCQPFSISGVSKKKSLGREHGFKDDEKPRSSEGK
jgi:DNA (cytosine-5)-methyltransferase 1